MIRDVLILGHRGMLGHVVADALRASGMSVSTLDPELRTADEIAKASAAHGGAVVNCIGKIPQRGGDYEINASLPVALRQHLNAVQRLIHASTDCVFSGKQGPYSVHSVPDPNSPYGESKLSGEQALVGREHTWTVRCSILGPELGTSFGLYEWALVKPSSQINGYTNHFWNGITTSEWALVCCEILSGLHSPGLLQPGAPSACSKYELLKMIRTSVGAVGEVEPFTAPESVDRRLVPTLARRPLEEQLAILGKLRAGEASQNHIR